jgi:hypothetical protein
MKTLSRYCVLFMLLLSMALLSGCATTHQHNYVEASNNNSCWIDPSVEPDPDMTLAAKICYYIWLPVLSFASSFHGGSL